MSNYPQALWPANLLLLVLGIMSAYTFSLYGRLTHATGAKSLGEIWARITMTGNDDRTAIADTSWIVSVANFVYCFGCCLTYILVIGDSLSGLLQGCGGSGIWASRQASILAVATTMLLPLVRLSSLSALAPMSIVGVLGTMVVAVFMCLQCPAIFSSSPYYTAAVSAAATKTMSVEAIQILHKKSILLRTAPLPPLFNTYHRLKSPAPLSLVAMACVAWMAHFSAPDFYHSLNRGSRLDKDKDDDEIVSTGMTAASTLNQFYTMTVLAYSIVAIVNAVVLSTGFLTFGGNSMGIILNNYSALDRGASLSRVLVLLSMIGGFPFVFHGCLSSATDLTSRRRPASAATSDNPPPTVALNQQTMTSVLLSVVTATALIVKDAGFVVSFNGALMGTAIIYIFPAFLYLRHTANKSRSLMSHWLRLERWFCKFVKRLACGAAAIDPTVRAAGAAVELSLMTA
jgi:amino acid permease